MERDRSAISEREIKNMASASSSSSASASASGSKLRADAKPYVRGSNIGFSSEVPLPATLCAFPVCDGSRMPVPVFKPFPDSPIEEVAPGGYTPGLLPPDENSARAFVKNFISVQLSKVSEEVDESLVDYVNALDPSKVAAQVEAVLFERWGFFDLSKPVSRNYSVVLSRLSNDGIKDFRRHILLGEISPQTLFNMSLDELWQKYLPPNRMGPMVWEF